MRSGANTSANDAGFCSKYLAPRSSLACNAKVHTNARPEAHSDDHHICALKEFSQGLSGFGDIYYVGAFGNELNTFL